MAGSSLSRTSSRTSRGEEAASPRSKPGGTVLSVAPLMGCEPDADPVHSQWLHVHVRPPVRALLKARSVQAEGIGMPCRGCPAELCDNSMGRFRGYSVFLQQFAKE